MARTNLTPKDCPLCAAIGVRCYADFDQGQELPPETRSLVTIHDDSLDPIRQCPSCQSCYQVHEVCDNDIIQPTHTVELTRISLKEARKRIRSAQTHAKKLATRQRNLETARRRRYLKKMESKLKASPAIGADERRVVDFLVEKGAQGTLAEIERALGLSGAEALALVKALRSKSLLWTAVDYVRDANGNLNPDPTPAPDTAIYLST